MATLKIQIKDSKFVSHNGVNVEEFTESYVKNKDWECRITDAGRVDCISTEFSHGERHQMKLKIDKGHFKLLLKIGDAHPKTLKSFNLGEWPANGVIILPGGFIDKRRPSFRNADFQKFLDEYGVTSVRCESPNRIYQATQEHNGHAMVFYETIETDGKATVISEDVKTDEKSKEKGFINHRMIEVTDATWVIKNVEKLDKYYHRILYTTDNPREIVGLPKLQ